jgi:hypothetical protein
MHGSGEKVGKVKTRKRENAEGGMDRRGDREKRHRRVVQKERHTERESENIRGM